ncbi:nucleotidyltransferase family protein [Streptomyces sp. NPDC005438]|uniref:nucleotidyltransferase family protein n=1 Tax=Streptomyces sp. NPDC005438 TaxID=3156880 RepID=UPI0033A22FEF
MSGAPVAGLVLAAGAGRRLGGRPKALLSSGGRPLVERAVDALSEGGCSPVYVVLGAEAAMVRARVAWGAARVVVNPRWAEGMGGSLARGLTAVADGSPGARAVVVLLVDQPRVGARAVSRVVDALEGPESLVTAAYGGRGGHPVLLGAGHWGPLREELGGDVGARHYLARHGESVRRVECGDVGGPEDVDTVGDLWLLD